MSITKLFHIPAPGWCPQGVFFNKPLSVQNANLGTVSLFLEFQCFAPVPAGSGTQVCRKNPCLDGKHTLSFISLSVYKNKYCTEIICKKTVTPHIYRHVEGLIISPAIHMTYLRKHNCKDFSPSWDVGG